MKSSKFEVEIDLTDKKQVLAFAALLLTIGGNSDELTEINAPRQTDKKEKVYKETPATTKAEETTSKNLAEDLKELSDKQETEKKLETEKKPETTIKLETLREVLGKKVGDHRETIKAKLTELEAKNVSVLKPEHYEVFLAFLNNL